MSLFISIEGGDGAGKTTQAGLLVDRLNAAGTASQLVREPGGTPLGEKIRPLAKGEASPTPLAELLLFEAARAELVECVIRPALARGAVVVSDRFTDSSLAYQGYGRGIDLDAVHRLNDLATSGLSPDATILLDIDPEAALARVRATGEAPRAGARRDSQPSFESQPHEFHERVAEGFRALAAAEPARWFVIDAARPVEAVAERIWAVVATLVPPPSGSGGHAAGA